jgi:replicative DNA helicase
LDFINILNIERLILSSIIFDYEQIFEISLILKKDDFYLKAHQDIYEVMLNLQEEGLPIDEEFIKNRVPKDNFNENILIDIVSSKPITEPQAYAFELKESSKLRKLDQLSKNIVFNISNEKNSQDIISNIQINIENIENETLQRTPSIKDTIKEIKADMKKASENGAKILGQSSGLDALDNILGAFEDGDLIIIAARPSMGKTSIISTIATQALKEKNGVLIESLEMPRKKIVSRLIASMSGESLTDLKKGLVKDINKFNQAIDFFENSDLIIHDKAYPTVLELQNRIKATLRRNPNIKNIFVDHTGKIQLLGKTREDIEIGHISAMLKKIARDYGIRVFLLQQLNRSLESRENKRPMLSDLKNSGNIEEDADIVLGLYRDSYYKKEKDKPSMFNNGAIEDAEILVLKNRDGRVGVAKVSFEGKSARFINKVANEPTVIEFE